MPSLGYSLFFFCVSTGLFSERERERAGSLMAFMMCGGGSEAHKYAGRKEGRKEGRNKEREEGHQGRQDIKEGRISRKEGREEGREGGRVDLFEVTFATVAIAEVPFGRKEGRKEGLYGGLYEGRTI